MRKRITKFKTGYSKTAIWQDITYINLTEEDISHCRFRRKIIPNINAVNSEHVFFIICSSTTFVC